MKKKTTVILLLSMMFVLFAAAGLLIFYLHQENLYNNPKVQTLNEVGLQTFADQTDNEVFQDIPLYAAEGVKMTDPKDRGDNVYMVTVNGTNKAQYEAYLQTLKDAGFTFFADNGEKGIAESVFTASFTKKDLTVTVTYVANDETVYLTSSNKMNLSEHLIYKDEYQANNVDGMKNTLHMLELYDYGNSFVFQLKNGHFIVSDGGSSNDIQYLIDYLESLTPNGEKPIIEAWFISHAHGDHNGALASLTSDTDLLQRIYIDGIYLSMPNNEALAAVNSTNMMKNMMMIQTLPSFAKASDGSNTKLYRPQTGQKYYFCDVVIDIMHTQEQLPTEDYANMDLNDSSMWTMFHIDEQKFMLSGDADKGSMSIVMRTYPKEYFEMDIYASFHHNLNNWLPFLELCTVKTTLFTTSGTEPQNKAAGEINGAGANAWLMKNSLDYYSWEDGGKVLTFPYKVGTARSLPMQQWTYHASRERTFSQSK